MLQNILQGLGVIHATFGIFSLGELFYVGVLSTRKLEIDMRNMILVSLRNSELHYNNLFGVAIGNNIKLQTTFGDCGTIHP